MSKKHHKSHNVPLYNIRQILGYNVVQIDKWYCNQISKNMFDIYFRTHVDLANNSVQFIIHNNRIVINIKYKNGKPSTMIGYYKSFTQLDDIIADTIEYIYH